LANTAFKAGMNAWALSVVPVLSETIVEAAGLSAAKDTVNPGPEGMITPVPPPVELRNVFNLILVAGPT